MSSERSHASARPRPDNIGVLLREPFRAGSEQLHRRLAERGHAEVRVPHAAPLQFLDEEGTQVSELARRAQMTKQSMAELVAHLERHGYVERVSDPADRRAKLVRATPRGLEVYEIAREAIEEIESDWAALIGRRKMSQLRELLTELNHALCDAASTTR
jgi:DNA-binding MarR family transcriptional regulator